MSASDASFITKAKLLGYICVAAAPPAAYVATPAKHKIEARHHVAKGLHRAARKIAPTVEPAAIHVPCAPEDTSASGGGLGGGGIEAGLGYEPLRSGGWTGGNRWNAPPADEFVGFIPGGGPDFGGGDGFVWGGGGGPGPLPVAPVKPVDRVPEPASWALMVIGFGAVGVAVRAKQSKVHVGAGA
jgi:hypothetical protein